MYIRITTFSLAIGRDEYLALAEQVASAFLAWPGLLAKYWLADEREGRFGGVYLFSSKQAADATRETDLYLGMLANPAFTDLEVHEFDVLAAPSALTAPSVVPVGSPAG